MYDRISSYIDLVHPPSRTPSLPRLLRSTLEYLRGLRYSEIWDNAALRGCNT